MSKESQHPPARKPVVHPLIDILDSEAELLLIADLPGVAQQDLELEIEAGTLNLSAQSESLEYRRSFSLSEDLDLDAVEAKLEHGVLRVQLPKRAAARVRKIQIRASTAP